MKNKTILKREAIERNTYWKSLSPQEQLNQLDHRLGKNIGAKRQREKLVNLITETT